MLFFGMCFETVQADSSILNPNFTQEDATICGTVDTDYSEQVYEQERLEQQRCVAQLERFGRRNTTRTIRGTILHMLFAGSLPQISHLFHLSYDAYPDTEYEAHKTIITYIHQKDGKKA